MNVWDVAVLAIIAVVVLAAVWSMRRDRRRGCSGGCATCLQAGHCDRQEQISEMERRVEEASRSQRDGLS